MSDEDDAAVQQQSQSALINAKRNLHYLVSPTRSDVDRPARFRTRVLLRTCRFVGEFILWRLVRWAKYVAVGALVAAVGATALGGVVSGVAWLAAPTTLGASVVAASVWGTGKFVARRLHRRWTREGGDSGAAMRERLQDDEDLRREGIYAAAMGPRALPW